MIRKELKYASTLFQSVTNYQEDDGNRLRHTAEYPIASCKTGISVWSEERISNKQWGRMGGGEQGRVTDKWPSCDRIRGLVETTCLWEDRECQRLPKKRLQEQYGPEVAVFLCLQS